MKRVFLTIVLSFVFIILTGCVGSPKTTKDATLQSVSHIKALTGLNSIAFEWKSIVNDPRAVGVKVYRADAQKKDFEVIQKITDRYATHFTDKNLKPNTPYVYKFVTYSSDGQESYDSELLNLKTVPLMEGVSFAEAIGNLPRQVKVIWRPHPSERIGGYIIERHIKGGEFEEIKKLDGRLQVEYIDTNLKDQTTYGYRVISVTYDGLQTQPSQIVNATTKPLPVTVTGLQASQNLPKKIELTWSPNPEKDIHHYNIYKSTLGSMLFIKKVEVSGETRYEDKITQDGDQNHYKITAVDIDGLESIKQEQAVMGQTLQKPSKPVITQGMMEGMQAVIRWQDGGDGRAVGYKVEKRFRNGILFKTEEMNLGANTELIDSSILPGVKYSYVIKAVDKFGITSQETDPVELQLPKMQ